MIKLGPGNDDAARSALAAWPGLCVCTVLMMRRTHMRVSIGALHIGGGVNADNALEWIELGAEKVCCVPIPVLTRGLIRKTT